MTISKNLIRFSLSFVDVFLKGKLLINEHVSFTKLLPFSKIIMEKRYYYVHWPIEAGGCICHTEDSHIA
jgi:hypothetical protein